MNINSEMNIISVVSWGGQVEQGDYYKVLGYIYDKKGHVAINKLLNEDSNF